VGFRHPGKAEVLRPGRWQTRTAAFRRHHPVHRRRGESGQMNPEQVVPGNEVRGGLQGGLRAAGAVHQAQGRHQRVRSTVHPGGFGGDGSGIRRAVRSATGNSGLADGGADYHVRWVAGQQIAPHYRPSAMCCNFEQILWAARQRMPTRRRRTNVMKHETQIHLHYDRVECLGRRALLPPLRPDRNRYCFRKQFGPTRKPVC
jgi:hypothetical protein